MSKSKPSKTSKVKYSKRLVSYTTAASLGAFGFDGTVNAAVVFIDIPDVTLSTTPSSPDVEEELFLQFFDVNNDGTDDIGFRARYRAEKNMNIDGTAGAGDTSFLGVGITTSILVPVAQSYYINAFPVDTLLGPSTPVALVPAPDYQTFLSLPYRYPSSYYPYYSYNGGQFGSGYVGFKFDISGNSHFGWAEVETNPGGELVSVVTIKSLAYESTANTEILTGDMGSGGVDGDFDNDGDVDGHDFLVWQRGGTAPPLDSALLVEWQDNYGTGSPLTSISAVPEPSTLALLAGGLGALAFKRRRKGFDV